MQYTVSGTDCVSIDGDERYPFLTAEAAKLFAGILNRDWERTIFQTSTNFYFTLQGSAVSNQFQTYFKSADKIIARWDHTGVLVELDLPYITWIWLRTTAPVRAAKALWRRWA